MITQIILGMKRDTKIILYTRSWIKDNIRLSSLFLRCHLTTMRCWQSIFDTLIYISLHCRIQTCIQKVIDLYHDVDSFAVKWSNQNASMLHNLYFTVLKEIFARKWVHNDWMEIAQVKKAKKYNAIMSSSYLLQLRRLAENCHRILNIAHDNEHIMLCNLVQKKVLACRVSKVRLLHLIALLIQLTGKSVFVVS